MGVWTNAGLTLAATALQTASGNAAIAYVGIGTGAGTLASAITSGAPLTSLTLDANVPVSLASGQSLTVTDGTNSETVTTSGAVTGGATNVILINSWTPVNNYAAHTSGVAPTPLATDTALYNEQTRLAANAGSAGANPGESLNAAYFDGTQASGFYMQVGFFSGAATSSVNTGTLVFEDIQVWNHTLNAESNIYQADSQI